ncbi:AAA family ATPase [Candidatus Woesearchaeota archaeon]|nr:AAA family ATPase [Candidatus Woesearchaeota archaeon]
MVYDSTLALLEEENALLRKGVAQLKDELERLKRSPLMVCEVLGIRGSNAVIKMPNGNKFFVEAMLDCGKLKPGELVFVEQKNLAIVKKASMSKRFNVEKFVIVEKPNVSWQDVGGLEEQIREIREIVELPLNKPELFEKIGIQPPKGVLLHGAPGTGKTLLAKAVATATNSTFIEVVGSELVQKFIGEGAKLVKEIFQMAREKAPAIIFIDELDALAAKRVDIGTSGEREVQRTFMQLLAEIDGFKGLGNVKIIGCTNRKDILDPAIMRPGRLERHIHFPVPAKEARKEIFKIHTGTMSSGKIDVDKVVEMTENLTGAEIKAVCTEAGYFAIREERNSVETRDFISAITKVRSKNEVESTEYVAMFG